ncbi:MAG: putative Ig domain-containing protein, partial [candidate division Zixibacteria bacterium]
MTAYRLLLILAIFFLATVGVKAQTLVVSNVPVGFFGSTQYLTHYDGTNFYLFYERNDANLYWQSSSDNVTWSGEDTLSPSGRQAVVGWDIWWEDDSTATLIVGDSIANTVTFHKIAISGGSTITLSGAETLGAGDFSDFKQLAVTMAGNTVFGVSKRAGNNLLFKRNTTGYPDGSGTYTTLGVGGFPSLNDNLTVIPYSDTAKVLVVRAVDRGGVNNDGWESFTWDGTSSTPSVIMFKLNASINNERGVAGVRVSDTDFRAIIASDGATAGTLTEWQWDGSSASWTSTVIDATNTSYKQPAMMREPATGDLYVFAQASGETNTPIYRYKNTGGSSWGTRVRVDDSETADHSIPVTQASEPPQAADSSRVPRELVWGYRVANGVNFDLKVGNLQLESSGINLPPVLDPIGAKAIDEGVNLNFGVSATDAEGALPTLTTSTLPSGANFTDNGNGTGSFDWTPDFLQSGSYNVTFYATDDSAAVDSEVVTITVDDAGNQLPILTSIGAQSTTENVLLSFGVSASDIESTPVLTTSSLPTGAVFTDNGNGTASFDWTPDFLQSGSYNVTFYATDDSSAVDSEVVTITVNDAGNQLPVLAAIGAQSTTENVLLSFGVSAIDIESTPGLTTSTLPSGAVFTDNGNGTGSFDWTPDFLQSGSNSVTFYATDDSSAVDSEVVTITVNDAGNQLPVLATIGAQSTTENVLLSFGVSASDIESTPTLTTSTLPTGAVFT